MTDFNEILNTDSVVFLSEDSYLAQRRLDAGIDQMKDLLKMAESGNLIPIAAIREGGQFRAVVLEEVFDGETLVLTSSISAPEEKEAFNELAEKLFRTISPSEIYEFDEKDRLLEKSVISFYSTAVLDYFTQVSPYFQDWNSVYSDSRIEKAAKVIKRLEMEGIFFGSGDTSSDLFSSSGSSILEICCGNGMSTIGLRKAGIDPEISADINDDEISVGLHHDVLKKDKTIVLDATKLSQYFDEKRFDACIGFMIGTIHMYDKEMWLNILREAVKVTKSGGRLLFTIRTKEETQIVDEFMKTNGINGLILDNRDNETEYDQWIWTGLVP